MSSVPTIGYWDIRGFAEPIRYLLHYVGVPFNEKRYQFGPGNSFADIKSIQEPWYPDKKSLGLDFPNIPYYIEDDFKLSQSLTILRYLARKHGLIATDEPNLTRQEMAEQQVLEMRDGLFGVIRFSDWEQKKPNFVKETLVPQLQLFAKFLGSNEWLSSKFSYADILAYETLDWLRLFSPETFDKFPTIKQYLLRFENLKPIKEYRNSSEFKGWPLFGPVMQWGYN